MSVHQLLLFHVFQNYFPDLSSISLHPAFGIIHIPTVRLHIPSQYSNYNSRIQHLWYLHLTYSKYFWTEAERMLHQPESTIQPDSVHPYVYLYQPRLQMHSEVHPLLHFYQLICSIYQTFITVFLRVIRPFIPRFIRSGHSA